MCLVHGQPASRLGQRHVDHRGLVPFLKEQRVGTASAVSRACGVKQRGARAPPLVDRRVYQIIAVCPLHIRDVWTRREQLAGADLDDA